MNRTELSCWLTAIGLVLAGCDADLKKPETRGSVQAAPPATSAGAARAAAPERLPADSAKPESRTDAALSAKVEAAIKAEPDLKGSAIAVRSTDGVVTLTGTTRDPQLRSMAAHVALSIEGVRLVRNELAVAMET